LIGTRAFSSSAQFNTTRNSAALDWAYSEPCTDSGPCT